MNARWPGRQGDNDPVQTLTAADRDVCARLCGGRDRLSGEAIASARRHRVHLLVAESLSDIERAEAQTQELARELRIAAVRDLRSTEAIVSLLDAFAAAAVETLVIKGCGLAHTVYSAPHLRVRVDTDVLIEREQLAAAERVLAREGWRRPIERDAELTAAQRHYSRDAAQAGSQHLDLHWRIANPLAFAGAVSFGDLDARAIPVPALGRHARMPGVADALFLACLHRVAHHDDEIQLLWLFDIHLLIGRASTAEREGFVQLARRKQMCAVCARGIELAAACFDTAGARELIEPLRAAASTAPEPSARFLSGSRPFSVLRSDLEAIRGWRGRAAFVAEHLFPSRSYMQSAYPACPPPLLPLAYGYRIVRGAPKWFLGR